MQYNDVHARLRQIIADKPDLLESFGSQAGFSTLIDKFQGLDRKFFDAGHEIWHVKDCSDESVASFEDIHASSYWDVARPSLPALTAHYLDALGVSDSDPEYDMALIAAALAEVEGESIPGYHNINHFIDVVAVTAQALHVNEEQYDTYGAQSGAVDLDMKDKALTLIAAIGHDIGHEGVSNPKDDIYFNERRSYKLLEAPLQAMGMGADDLSRIDLMLKTTSPNGPHTIIKRLGLAAAKGQDVSWDAIDNEGRYPELQALHGDPKLIAQAAILHAADLFASSASLRSNVTYSKALTKEYNGTINFNEPDNRAFFLDVIVGKDGFTFAPAVNVIIESSFNNLRDLNDMLKELEAEYGRGFERLGVKYNKGGGAEPKPQ